MTREQQKQIREQKIAAQKSAREEKVQKRKEEANWNKSVKRWKDKGAWIEETELAKQ
jgi:hypothetical protein